jgi:hypothetical protein
VEPCKVLIGVDGGGLQIHIHRRRAAAGTMDRPRPRRVKIGWREVVSRRHLKLSVLGSQTSTMTCRRRGGEEGEGTEATAAGEWRLWLLLAGEERRVRVGGRRAPRRGYL